jgi:hypothetical protein
MILFGLKMKVLPFKHRPSEIITILFGFYSVLHDFVNHINDINLKWRDFNNLRANWQPHEEYVYPNFIWRFSCWCTIYNIVYIVEGQIISCVHININIIKPLKKGAMIVAGIKCLKVFKREQWLLKYYIFRLSYHI